MSRQVERIPPTREERRKCEARWRGGSCKKRTCEICGLVWAKDWRRVVFEALKSLGVPVALSAVTPPGMDQLPWDERHCAHLGPHKHGKRHGCRVDENALAEWSYDVSRRWKRLHNAAPQRDEARNGSLPSAGHTSVGATGTWARARPSRVCTPFPWRYTRRRVLPRSLGSTRSETRLRSRRPEAGSEPSDHERSAGGRVPVQLLRPRKGWQGDATGERKEPHLPHMLIWVSPKLTRATGVNMRNLRRCRQLWAVRRGLLPPPNWSGVELARVIAIAGTWPARGP